MSALLDQRDGREIERVARRRLEGADAALAEHHLIVSAREEVFGREKPLLYRRRRAALQKHGAARASQSLEQREVLHVARADLEQSSAVQRRELRRLHHLGHGG